MSEPENKKDQAACQHQANRDEHEENPPATPADGLSSVIFALEYQLIIEQNAFQKWVVRCMAAAGYPSLNSLDVIVLNTVNIRARNKKVRDIAVLLNLDDVHTVTYALKKLEKSKLLTARREGKEKYYTTTTEGREVCKRYFEVRQSCFVDGFHDTPEDIAQIETTTELVRTITGLYEHAARAATAM